MPTRRTIVLALGALTTLGAASGSPAVLDWAAYAGLLARHTRGGSDGVQVDYAALGRDPALALALAAIAGAPPPGPPARAERLAFYINAYNLLALKTVSDHWPVSSIKDVGNLLRPVWDRPAGRVAGRILSLNAIENDELRSLGEPRIHFAIVCASRSCPDLRREPYLAGPLSTQLDDQVQRFLANPVKGLRVEGRTLRASRIFAWFADDFTASGGPLAFVRRYRPDLPAGVRFRPDLPYDWSVNDYGGAGRSLP